jgi:hypothetical protein
MRRHATPQISSDSKRQRTITEFFPKPTTSSSSSVVVRPDTTSPPLNTTRHKLQSEGIDVNSNLTVKRDAKCNEVLTKLEDDYIVLVRAPPYSGKTAFASLLEKKAADLNNYEWIRKVTLIDDTKIDSVVETISELRKEGENTPKPRLLIIDEIQVSYDTQNNPKYDQIWKFIKLVMQDRSINIRVLLLGSYGGKVNSKCSTPVAITATLGLSFIDFNVQEYDDLISRYNMHLQSEQFQINEKMKTALYGLTAGHPGLTTLALQKFTSDYLQSTFTHVSVQATIGETDFIEFLLGTFVKYCRLSRAVNTSWLQDAAARRIVERTLLQGKIDTRSLTNCEYLIQFGVLAQTNDTECSFSAPIVRSLIIEYLYGSKDVICEHSSIDTLPKFIAKTVESFDHQQLKNSLSIGSDGNIYERQFQMEFYRQAVPLARILAQNCYPDVGSVFDSDGYLDFYINSDLKWAIEITRNSSKIDEHLIRFSEEGIYANIKPNKWIVLNFIQIDDRNVRSRNGYRQPAIGEVQVFWKPSSADYTIVQINEVGRVEKVSGKFKLDI